jgi:hypothetical protein
MSAKPLYLAARGGHLEVVIILVQKLGADVNQAMQNGRMPMMIAAQINNLPVCGAVLGGARRGRLVNQGTPNGYTPLMMTAEGAIIRCLIQLGAEVGAVNSHGKTALLMSAAYGHYSAMQYLQEEANANMDDVITMVSLPGTCCYDTLRSQMRLTADDDKVKENPAALSGLLRVLVLRVLVLRGAPPPALVALLLATDANMVQEGARLRARIPAYLARCRASWTCVARVSLCCLVCCEP